MTLPTNEDIRTFEFLTTTDLASILGISRHALHQRINRGTVPPPHRKLGDGRRPCLLWVMTEELDHQLAAILLRGH